MADDSISADDPHPRQRVEVFDSFMSYVDTGEGAPVVFLHGNPTSSYLWRNIIPYVSPEARCLAPDLIGMGASGQAPDGNYSFSDHARYLDAWFDAVIPEAQVALVLHDWGGALGFYWARRNPDRVRAIAYMETIVCCVDWSDWPDSARGIFQGMRSPKGEELVLERNLFIEGILPNAILRELTPEEHDVYRAPWRRSGESRRPMLTWPREIPIEGEPKDVARIVDAYSGWLKDSPIPKLFVNAEPGSILVGRQREFCRTWANQEEVTVAASPPAPQEIAR
jgi:haloalkane dehalogenase